MFLLLTIPILLLWFLWSLLTRFSLLLLLSLVDCAYYPHWFFFGGGVFLCVSFVSYFTVSGDDVGAFNVVVFLMLLFLSILLLLSSVYNYLFTYVTVFWYICLVYFLLHWCQCVISELGFLWSCLTPCTIDMHYSFIPLRWIDIMHFIITSKSRLCTSFGWTMMKYVFTSPPP